MERSGHGLVEALARNLPTDTPQSDIRWQEWHLNQASTERRCCANRYSKFYRQRNRAIHHTRYKCTYFFVPIILVIYRVLTLWRNNKAYENHKIMPKQFFETIMYTHVPHWALTVRLVRSRPQGNKQDRQCTYNVMDAHLCNYCYCGKSISITYWVYL